MANPPPAIEFGDMPDPILARFLIETGLPANGTTNLNGTLLDRNGMYTNYDAYFNALNAPNPVNAEYQRRQQISQQHEAFNPVNLPTDIINNVCAHVFINQNGSRYQKCDRLKFYGVNVQQQQPQAAAQLAPGKQINLKTTLDSITDINVFRNMEEEVSEKAKLLLIFDIYDTGYNQNLPAVMDDMQERDMNVLHAAIKDAIAPTLKQSFRMKVTEGIYENTAVGLMRYLREASQRIGVGQQVIDTARLNRMSWKESKKSLLEFVEDLRTETSKLPQYPPGITRETFIRDKILSQVKNTEHEVKNVIDTVTNHPINDPQGTVDYLVQELSKRFIRNTSQERQCEVYATDISVETEANIAKIRSGLSRQINNQKKQLEEKDKQISEQQQKLQQSEVDANLAQKGNGKGSYNKKWNNYQNTGNQNSDHKHCKICFKYWADKGMKDSKKSAYNSHDTKDCKFKNKEGAQNPDRKKDEAGKNGGAVRKSFQKKHQKGGKGGGKVGETSKIKGSRHRPIIPSDLIKQFMSKGGEKKNEIPSWISSKARKVITQVMKNGKRRIIVKKKKKAKKSFSKIFDEIKKKTGEDVKFGFTDESYSVDIIIELDSLITDFVNSGAIIDSGTKFIISKHRKDFKNFSSDKAVIRGVGGRIQGIFGTMADNILGRNIQAIFAPELPVCRLISVEQIKENGWETFFTIEGNYLKHKLDNKRINLVTNDKGLPFLENLHDNFYHSESNFTYSFVGENIDFVRDIVQDEGEQFECYPVDDIESDTEKFYDPVGKKHMIFEKGKSRPDGRFSRESSYEHQDVNSDQESIRLKYRLKTNKSIPKLLQHYRNGHMHDPNNPNISKQCPACSLAKSRRVSHNKERKQIYNNEPFIILCTDFFGKVKPSTFRGNNWVMLFVDDCSGYSIAEPIAVKSEAPEVLEKVVKEIRAKCGVDKGQRRTPVKQKLIIAGVRSDNEPVFKSTKWKNTLEKLDCVEIHSTPYNPQGNSVVERLVGTMKSNLRATMIGVDPRLWDFAVQYLSDLYNQNSKRQKRLETSLQEHLRKSPNMILKEASENPIHIMRDDDRKYKHRRRFGCLVHFKIFPEPTQTLDKKRKMGVFLGWSRVNSSYLVGTLIYDRRSKKERLAVYQSKDVIFRENILVDDLGVLGEDGGQGTSELLDVLGTRSLRELAERSNETDRKYYTDNFLDKYNNGLDIEEPDKMFQNEDKPEQVSNKEDTSGLMGSRKSPPSPEEARKSSSNELKSSSSNEIQQSSSNDTNNNTSSHVSPSFNDHGVRYGPLTEKRGRGRPKGSRDKLPRKRRRKNDLEKGGDTYYIDNFTEHVEDDIENNLNNFDSTQEYNDYSFLSEIDFEEEEIVDIEITPSLLNLFEEVDSNKTPKLKTSTHNTNYSYNTELNFKENDQKDKPVENADDNPSVSAKVALDPSGKHYHKWIEALTLEKTRLESYKTWRVPNDQELELWKSGKLKAVPCAILFTKKRDGTFKSRLIILGNRWSATDGNPSVFAGTVSNAANRVMLIESARNNFYMSAYDVKNAFIRTQIDRLVMIKLPKQFLTSELDSGLRVLIKALYGLPISPRLWNKTYSKDLEKLGFKSSKVNPGIFVKKDGDEVVMYLSVYVDDCILCCKYKNELEKMLITLDKLHPIKIIPAKIEKDGTQILDILGQDVSYNRKRGELKISMENYINKFLKDIKFKGKEYDSPAIDVASLYDEKSPIVTDFPLRKVTGTLQWLSLTCRPDVQFTTNILARVSHLETRKTTLAAVKRVLGYLKKTADTGLTYSPENERKFNDVCKNLEKHEQNVENNHSDNNKNSNSCVKSFGDASFASTIKLQSISGLVIFYRGAAVMWKSSVQSVMSYSTCASEMIALSDLIQLSDDVFQIEQLLRNGIEDPEVKNDSLLYSDNRATILNSKKDCVVEVGKRSRHVALRNRRVIAEGDRTRYCPTKFMPADGLTKSPSADMVTNLLSPHTAMLRKVVEEYFTDITSFLSYRVT